MQAVAERIRAILFLVHPILAEAVAVARRDIPQTVPAHVLKMLSTQIGLEMGTATTVPTSGMVFRST